MTNSFSKLCVSVNSAAPGGAVTASLASTGGEKEKSGSLGLNKFEPAPLTQALYRGLELILAHHRASSEVRRQLEIQLSGYLDSSSDETVWLKRAKWTLAYPLSKYLRNELPPQPDIGFRPTGCLRDWMKQRLVSYCRRNTHLWYSWLQCKRVALPASTEIVEKTYDSHLKALTSPDSGDPWVIEQIFTNETFLKVLKQVRSAVTAATEVADHSFDEGRTSLSACFEEKRKEGGQHGYLRRLALSENLFSDDLVRLKYHARAYVKGSLTYNVMTEIREPYGADQWRSYLKGERENRDHARRLRCTIQAVLEPMKVRVISKGEAIPYYLARPIQKAMHSVMRQMECFRLIGAPLCPTNLIDLTQKAESWWKWFSIDYSAATDGLSWRYSGRIFKYIIGGLPADLQALCMQVLGPHDLYYPNSRDHECPWVNGHANEFRGTMTTGQLMGSILSFPILCLANLGVYLLNMCMEQRDWTHEERLRHVLINGDDMVYSGPEALWESHIDIGKSVGLNMSVGKAYIHDSYLNVNSTSIDYPLDRKSSPWQINFLNTGLFFGQHKVLGKSDGDDHVPSITSNIGTILAGSLPGRQGEILEHLLLVHREAIDRERTVYSKRKIVKRNLFLPQSVGGMGVPCPAGFKFAVTTDQRRLAAAIYKSLNVGDVLVDLARPLLAYELLVSEERKLPFTKTWLSLNLDAPRVRLSRGKTTQRTCGTVRVNDLLTGFYPVVLCPYQAM